VEAEAAHVKVANASKHNWYIFVGSWQQDFRYWVQTGMEMLRGLNVGTKTLYALQDKKQPPEQLKYTSRQAILH
jgi:hypothetical protein